MQRIDINKHINYTKGTTYVVPNVFQYMFTEFEVQVNNKPAYLVAPRPLDTSATSGSMLVHSITSNGPVDIVTMDISFQHGVTYFSEEDTFLGHDKFQTLQSVGYLDIVDDSIISEISNKFNSTKNKFYNYFDHTQLPEPPYPDEFTAINEILIVCKELGVVLRYDYMSCSWVVANGINGLPYKINILYKKPWDNNSQMFPFVVVDKQYHTSYNSMTGLYDQNSLFYVNPSPSANMLAGNIYMEVNNNDTTSFNVSCISSAYSASNYLRAIFIDNTIPCKINIFNNHVKQYIDPLLNRVDMSYLHCAIHDGRELNFEGFYYLNNNPAKWNINDNVVTVTSKDGLCEVQFDKTTNTWTPTSNNTVEDIYVEIYSFGFMSAPFNFSTSHRTGVLCENRIYGIRGCGSILFKLKDFKSKQGLSNVDDNTELVSVINDYKHNLKKSTLLNAPVVPNLVDYDINDFTIRVNGEEIQPVINKQGDSLTSIEIPIGNNYKITGEFEEYIDAYITQTGYDEVANPFYIADNHPNTENISNGFVNRYIPYVIEIQYNKALPLNEHKPVILVTGNDKNYLLESDGYYSYSKYSNTHKKIGIVFALDFSKSAADNFSYPPQQKYYSAQTTYYPLPNDLFTGWEGLIYSGQPITAMSLQNTGRIE